MNLPKFLIISLANMEIYLQAFYLKVLKMSTCPAPLKTKMRRLNNSAFMIKRPRKKLYPILANHCTAVHKETSCVV